MRKTSPNDLVSNRKAFHEYEILETFEAGIVLVGTEVKSLKSHHGSLQDAYVLISEGEAILKNASITCYSFGNVHNHKEKRERKLLLHKREIEKLKIASSEKGLTLIPLAMYTKEGLIKVKVGIAKGKKLHDKREAVKEKQDKRQIARALKNSE